MPLRGFNAVFVLILLSVLAAAQELPRGIVLPLTLNSTIDAGKDRAGQPIGGKIMQVVDLPDGSRIPCGAKITGHIVSASKAASGAESQVTIRFERLVFKGRSVPIVAHLRALASLNEVFEAKMPTNSWDEYGTSSSDWNTVQIGGAGVYRGNGQVVSDGQVVGRATDDGAVTAKLEAAPAAGCSAGDAREQALWLFSPWACGVYGLDDVKIAHAGRTAPTGQITLTSIRNVHISSGSGWLLRTDDVLP